MAETQSAGGTQVNNPKKSTAGSTSGAAVGFNAGNAVGGGGFPTINNPPKNKSLHGRNPSRGGFSGKHVSVKATSPGK